MLRWEKLHWKMQCQTSSTWVGMAPADMPPSASDLILNMHNGADKEVLLNRLAIQRLLSLSSVMHSPFTEGMEKSLRAIEPGATFTIAEDVEARIESGKKLTTSSGRTTLLLIVTNQKLDHRELRSLARQVNAAMGRVIQPLAAFDDGDVTYAVTTNEVSNDRIGVTALGVMASELAWDAALSIFQK